MKKGIGIVIAILIMIGVFYLVFRENGPSQEELRKQYIAQQKAEEERLASLPMPGVELTNLKELEDRMNPNQPQYRAHAVNRKSGHVFGYNIKTDVFMPDTKEWKSINRQKSTKRDVLGEHITMPFYISSYRGFSKIRFTMYVYDQDGKEYSVEKIYENWEVVKAP